MSKNEICLYGSVGMSWWGEDYFTAKMVRDMLAGMTGPLTVRINSGGGIATEGQAIYTMLVDYPDDVDVVIEGAAMSAASLIAMAGDTITMRLGSFLLIHDPASPWTEGRGTEEDHLRLAKQLNTTASGYAAIYARRSGKDKEQARAIMRDETLMDAETAIAEGFATDTDDEPADVAARFDYRMYAHAPQAWRDASEGLGKTPGKEAIMAMIAGTPRKKQETKMADKTAQKAKADASAETEDDVKVLDAQPPASPEAEAVAKAATAAERSRVTRIRNAAMMARVPDDFATDLIARGVSEAAAVDAITAKWKEMGDVDQTMQGREPARIMRDERETRLAGMGLALSAQMSGKAPTDDKARAFMGMSLVEMAADCIGHKGPIRTAGDKINIMMNATHSRSDFTGIFENALNKQLLDRYEVQAPTYREFSRKRTFNDFRVHPMVRAGDFPRLQPVGEGGEIKFGTFGEKRETAVLSSFGIGLRFSRQMIIDDDLSAVDSVVGDYGSMVADFEEQQFYTFMASATLASDGLAVWLTAATRANLAASGTAITIASLAAGQAAIRKQTTIDGMKTNIIPTILLVGPDKEIEALQLVTQITPALAPSVNPFAGRLRVVVSAQITGNTWYMFADPTRAGAACFVYGYLNGMEQPRLRMDEPFGQQGMSVTLEHDFGYGAIDFRGTYRNPGA